MKISKFVRNSALIAAAFVMSGYAAMANAGQTYDFTYTDSISSAFTPGITAGDTFTVHLLANNGGSTTVNQSWANTDVLGFTISAGSYFASYSTPWTLFNLTTDASGNLSNVAFYGTDFSSVNTDNFGTWTADTVFGNASFVDYLGNANYIVANTFNNVDQWTISPASGNVPEPATLSLFGIALAGLAFSKRKKA